MSTEPPIDKTRRIDGSWNYIAGYLCRNCGDVARAHPETNWIWGCLKCGYAHLTTIRLPGPALTHSEPPAARSTDYDDDDMDEEDMDEGFDE